MQRPRARIRYGPAAKTEGVSQPIDELRAVVARAPAPPDEMAAYLAKVRGGAYAVTDAEVESLKARFGEDEIFEQTVAAAISEGLRRFDRAQEIIG
jgi:hypothetical protein